METVATDQLERAARDAAAAFAAVRDDPTGRYELAEHFFADPKDLAIHGFGRAELSFIEWEIRRGVLNPILEAPSDAAPRRGSAWWRAVNETILLDAAEAQALYDAGVDLVPQRPNVERWLAFLRNPGPITFYQAHNASVVAGFFAAAPLAVHETPVERTLMNLTLARVLFVQAMAECPAVALGRFKCVGRVLSTPRSAMVTVVVRHPDLYPDHYELTNEDRERMHGQVRTPSGMIAAFVDDVLLASRLRQVYGAAAESLAEPRLLDFLVAGRPSYPWGLPDIGPPPERHDPWPHPRRFARLCQRILEPIIGRPARPAAATAVSA